MVYIGYLYYLKCLYVLFCKGDILSFLYFFFLDFVSLLINCYYVIVF